MTHNRLSLAELFSRPWFRVALHLAVLLALIGALGGSVFADRYFNRGVTYRARAGEPPIPHTEVNPLGVNTLLNEEADPDKVVQTLDMIAAGGFTYVRQMFPWYEIEPAPGVFWDDRHNVSTWDKYDRIVNLAHERGLEIVARLDKPPLWAREGAPNLEAHPDGPPNDDADFARFVGILVERYKGKIHYVQIWNEPNLQGEWGGLPIDPARFTQLLKAAYLAAKAADPAIVVMMPGLAPTDQHGPDNLSDLLFLQGMYDAGAKDYFDIGAVMVYGYGYSPNDRRVEFARNNFSRPVQTREIMVRNGDARKAIWAVEYGWVSLPRNWTGEPSPWGRPVSEQQQAEYLYEGYLRAQREWPWMGAMCIWTFRWTHPPTDPDQIANPTRGFAIVNYDFTPRAAYRVLSQARQDLDRAFTGSYAADSRLLKQDGDWSLTIAGGEPKLTPDKPGAITIIPFSGSRLDLRVGGAGQGFAVTVDGKRPGSLPGDGQGRGIVEPGKDENSVRDVTIAEGMSDGSHAVEIIALGGGENSASIQGFSVSRRPWSAWIYPWIDAALGALMILALASLRWTLTWSKNRPEEPRAEPIIVEEAPPATPRVRPASELRAERGPAPSRTRRR